MQNNSQFVIPSSKSHLYRKTYSKTPDIQNDTTKRRKKFIHFPSVRHEDDTFKTCVTESYDIERSSLKARKPLKLLHKIDMVSCFEFNLELEKSKKKFNQRQINISNKFGFKSAEKSSGYSIFENREKKSLFPSGILIKAHHVNNYIKKRSKLREKINLVGLFKDF